jgi:hypothetical protein
MATETLTCSCDAVYQVVTDAMRRSFISWSTTEKANGEFELTVESCLVDRLLPMFEAAETEYETLNGTSPET